MLCALKFCGMQLPPLHDFCTTNPLSKWFYGNTFSFVNRFSHLFLQILGQTKRQIMHIKRLRAVKH